ncbi:type II toxin-antitoxin system RelE/ParE family toxin [Catalinimonas niigatensis]|uniref:type II toxin-antitoxin system RelE/ParE family toxin n=1 Tax=Catalinimonas niigatensis TaxID=1397264 RepID=UPI002665B8B9|nr:type II toxin-antitoxin system RelE/ParE family toxin [Catalinimonas niigatensis]WPP53735.1 type II toxin-antitoxin system RelE/ParE family toxin [Catalinimonas niigatensis]
MSFEVVYTDNFEKELKRLAKKPRSLKKDLEILISALELNPTQSTSVGKDCYKISMAISSKGKGKSGGARVITHMYISGKLVYLLSIYDKSDQDNISDKELEALLRFIQ